MEQSNLSIRDFWTSSSFLVSQLLLLLLFLRFCYKFYYFEYWKKHGICHATPSIPFGNLPTSFFFGRSSITTWLTNLYERFKNKRYFGVYMLGRPILVINDPEYIRLILGQHFHKFADRGWFVDENIDPMSNNLFLQPYAQWNRLRRKFTPLFSPARLKNMHPLIVAVSNSLVAACNYEIGNGKVLEVSDLMERYSIDIISSIVYGSKDSSLENPGNQFHHLGRSVFEMGNINILIGAFFPELLQMVTLPLYKKKIKQFFLNLLKKSVEGRRKFKVKRNDFVELLMQLMDEGKVEEAKSEFPRSPKKSKTDETDDKLSMLEAAAQALIFFLAGYETAASTATFCLYELALNRDIQVKLQAEIDRIKEQDAEFTYDNIMHLEYLDKVISETLRKHAIVPFLSRICLEDYLLPDGEFKIPKGMRIMFSVTGIQNDPKFYENPDIFDPERFSKENAANRNNYTYLIFGEGSRNCIGKRFGIMEVKQVIATMVYTYNFWLSDKTRIPLQYDNSNLMHIPKGGIYLRVEKRRTS